MWFEKMREYLLYTILWWTAFAALLSIFLYVYVDFKFWWIYWELVTLIFW